MSPVRPSEANRWRENVAFPWFCGMTADGIILDEWCGKPITKIGKFSQDGCVHHIDEDPWNRDWANLQIVHVTCHRQHHQVGKPGRVLSEEARNRISAALKGRAPSPTTVAKIVAKNTGRKRSPEARENLRQAALRREERKRDHRVR